MADLRTRQPRRPVKALDTFGGFLSFAIAMIRTPSDTSCDHSYLPK